MMIMKSDQFRQIEDTLRHIDNNIISVFQYPPKIMKKVKDLFFQLLNRIDTEYTVVKTNFTTIIPIYLKEIETIVFTYQNTKLFSIKFLETVKSVIGRKPNMNYTFPLTKIQMDSNKTNHSTNMELISTDVIRKENTWSGVVIDENLNIFRELFENDKLDKFDIANIIDDLNKLFFECLLLFSEYFITDFSHQQFLTEQISYQQKVEAILSSIEQIGNLDTTKDILTIIVDFGNHYLKIPIEHFEFFSEGNEITLQEAQTVRYLYPSHIHINKKPSIFEHNTFKKLIINIETELKLNKVSFDKDKRKFNNLSFSTLSELEDFLEQQIDVLFGGYFTSGYRIRNLNAEVFPKLQLDSFFLITSKSEFEINTIDDLFKNYSSQMVHSLYGRTPKKQRDIVETLRLISITYSNTTLIMKPFDLIEYLHNLAFEVKRFFVETMNLKAILKKNKYTERWDGSKGYLDVNATVTKSLSKGWITPQQSYRKKMSESPPTIFLIYDISSSMVTSNANTIRPTQFLLTTLLSFFDKDVYKLNVGYITNTVRDAGLFKSEEKDLRTKKRKQEAFDIGEREQNIINSYENETGKNAIENDEETDEYKQWKVDTERETVWSILRGENMMNFAYRNLGELINDYYTERYDDAIRDFLDNESAGATGTNLDILALLPRHPDMDSRGLKYVFILTDAMISKTEKIDFVRISKELIQREDVRYFFIWTTYQSETYDYLSTSDNRLHFQTKQYIRRMIDNLIMNPDGSMKKVAELSNVDAELQFLVFLYDYYDYIYIVNPKNLLMIGEMKNILHKLEEQKFFIP